MRRRDTAGKMPGVSPTRISAEQAHGFLSARLGPIPEPEPLGGGFWSSAFAVEHEGRELVARFGEDRAWFEADRDAMPFASECLPVPEVIEIDAAFGGAYALSVRHRGVYLEDVRAEQAGATAPMLASLLGALFQAPRSPDLAVGWHWRPDPGRLSWRQWLTQGLRDDPGARTHGWRRLLHGEPRLDRLFRHCEARIAQLLDACPERRDLVHGDLLHANVLVSEDGARPTAVFSWKCSARGDFLYDTAWCTFWSPFHPGIAAIDPWRIMSCSSAVASEPGAWTDAAARHHCYELQIGATHLGWCAWVRDPTALNRVAEELEAIAERGPRSA